MEHLNKNKKIILLIVLFHFLAVKAEWVKFYNDDVRISYYENQDDFGFYGMDGNEEIRQFVILTLILVGVHLPKKIIIK
jgi:hypothetical protein